MNTGVVLSIQNFTQSIWEHGTTYSLDSNTLVTLDHVYTTGGTSPRSDRFEPESNKLYAAINGLTPDLYVFNVEEKSYVIKLQVIVEDTPTVELFVKVGNQQEIGITLFSNQEDINGVIDYIPKQYDLSFIYTTPGTLSQEDKEFYLRKGRGGKMRVTYLEIEQREYEYHPVYNNELYQNSINFSTNEIMLPNDPEVDVLGVSSDANLVSINIGNGLFKSGIWENGIWNNGYRSNSFVNEEDYYRFLGIVGLNGIFPYGGKGTYQISSTTWLVTLQSLDNLTGLNLGDKVSIGNLVAIDLNESRKLIKDYFTITQIDTTNNTIVVELVSNFPIIRVEIDSPNHLIYVSKNIWLSGAFLNGTFRGIWNNGLFKSYPRSGIIVDSHWIDGKIDGGRFISRKSGDLGFTYSTSVLQNLIFLDNNDINPNFGDPKYNSWMDLNYDEYVYSTINKDSSIASLETYPDDIFFGLPNVFTYSTVVDEVVKTFDAAIFQDPNFPDTTLLQGGITNDVLESSSSFKHLDNLIYKYKLGTKYRIYENFIPNNGNFLEPFSNNLGFGIDMTAFENDGWTYIDFAEVISATTSDEQYILPSNPVSIDSNVTSTETLSNQMRFRKFGPSSIIQIWVVGQFTIDFRFIRIILNNDNIVTERNRYYATSVNLEYLIMSTASFSGTGQQASAANFNLSPDINDRQSPSLNKMQFFFNKKKLDLNIEIYSSIKVNNSNQTAFPLPLTAQSDNNLQIVFNNISFYEVDMIPFFNYFVSERYIDTRVKTPWFAVAPFIDYSNANFDFLGNVNLTIDSELVNNQADFSVISSGVIRGNISTPGGGVLTYEVTLQQ